MAGSLAAILITVIVKGLPALNWAMLTQTPKGGYYLGKEGGILNAILGSLYLAGGATLLALLIGLPMALYLEVYVAALALGGRRAAGAGRDVGHPSIVYGAFGFTIMLLLGLRASLLGGIIALTLLELPIMTRAMDEVITHDARPSSRRRRSRWARRGWRPRAQVIVRQALPGIITGVLLAFGRGIGDAAAVLFTAGYTDRLPTRCCGRWLRCRWRSSSSSARPIPRCSSAPTPRR